MKIASTYPAVALLVLSLTTLASAQSWPVSTPEQLGLDASVLAALDTDIARGKYGNTDSMLVIRHGQIAYDRIYPHNYSEIYGEQARKPGALNPHDFGGPYNYFNPWWHPYYRGGDLHTLQSVTKTVTSVVIGVAITRGEFPAIDTPVLQFFPGIKVANIDERKRRMTIRHLLTMTAGFDWNEGLPYTDPANTGTAMEAAEDWITYTIDRPMSDEPGARFNYNSGATILLGYIFEKVTGHDIEEYAAKYLFAPLGIEHYFWKRTPSGLADTEGGLYLERHDLARIAALFQNKGDWHGKQIVSAAWVKDSLTPATIVSKERGIKYGFKWWLYPYGKNDPRVAFAGSGFGGQHPIVIPEYDLVLVFTAWNILGEKGLDTPEAIARISAAVKDRE
jgi:CubicO group peptidase (beta-lactamase class C family)